MLKYFVLLIARSYFLFSFRFSSVQNVFANFLDDIFPYFRCATLLLITIIAISFFMEFFWVSYDFS